MSHKSTYQPCPCGSTRPLTACCEPYLDGAHAAPTAEALMRSRYTAYVLRRADYLLATWDPATRPAALDLSQDRTEWLGLQIHDRAAGGEADSEGRVRFVARFRQRGAEHTLSEDSRFRKDGDRWLYIDGDTATRGTPATAAAKPGRNDPCPCGSGQKYKRCCGA